MKRKEEIEEKRTKKIKIGGKIERRGEDDKEESDYRQKTRKNESIKREEEKE